MQYLNWPTIARSLASFHEGLPFHHCIIDEFFHEEVARQLENDILAYDNPKWFFYDNAIENKKTCNDWSYFPSGTYRVLQALMSGQFLASLESLIDQKIYVDHGLHGGGWHIHGPGGNLNPHLDYSIHPKMRRLRKLNLIVYLSENLQNEHGGHLGLWEHDSSANQPGELKVEISPKFNRAVLFDTTQNSWHGMSRALSQPDGIYRKSMAIYYLIDAPSGIDQRERALFAPRDEQKNDEAIRDLIRLRSDANSFHQAYRKK